MGFVETFSFLTLDTDIFAMQASNCEESESDKEEKLGPGRSETPGKFMSKRICLFFTHSIFSMHFLSFGVLWVYIL
jgi:hypothetical protein